MRFLRLACLLPFVAVALAPAQEAGSVVLSGDSKLAAARLEEVRKLLAGGAKADAIAPLQALIDATGNDLVAVSDSHSVSARWLAHAALARLDRKALDVYRKRVETQARKLLEQADASADLDPLYRVVEETFCGRQTPQVLDRLGDLAFARGRFDEAESWWRLVAPLSPDAAKDSEIDVLVYPDPPPELLARTRAKQLLARLFRPGAWQQADLDEFRKLHPKAAGVLAGRKGLYADTLATLAADRAATAEGGDWPTFAGGETRGRVAAGSPRLLDDLSRLCRAGPTWTFDLENRLRQDPQAGQVKKGTELDAARRLAFHPAVVGQMALVVDTRYLTAYDLRNGRAEEWYDAGKQHGGIRPSMKLPAIPDLRYTLTVAEGCVFARFGSPAVRDVRPQERKADKVGLRPRDDGDSLLVCLGLKFGPDGTPVSATPRWEVRAIEPGRKEYAVFEGAPVVHEGRVYIAATRFDGDRVVTAIHCYAAHPEDTTPALLWRTDVCETRELAAIRGDDERIDQKRYRHHLLTLAGSRLVYCSHSGAVAAVDVHTGRRAWARKYPRRETREPEDNPTLRDLAPPVFAEGRLYVAPADSERLMCLDPLTGATIWERERLDVVHMVGVGSGRLIFTTWRNPRQGQLFAGGLRAVVAADGSDKGGWALPDDGGGLIPFGRPLLVGDLVLWPTARQPYGVFAVRQADGLQADNPSLLHLLPSGNLVYGNGSMLVADQQTLWAFVPGVAAEDEKVGRRGDPLRRQLAELFRAGRDGWRRVSDTPALRDQAVEDERGLPQQAGLVARKRLGGVKAVEVKAAIGEVNQLAWPLATRVRMSLGRGERFLPVAEGQGVYSGKPGEVVCRSRETGTLSWRCAVNFAPTWGAALGKLLIAGGAEGLAGVDGETGRLHWAYPAPVTGRYPTTHGGDVRVIDDPRNPLSFSDFHLLGERVVVLQGQRRLLCLDATTGEAVWQRYAPAALLDLPEPRGRFQSLTPIGADRLYAQFANRRWLLDVATGAARLDTPTDLDRWRRPPLVVPDGKVVLVPRSDRVEMVDPVSGTVTWTFTLQGKTTLSGEPPMALDGGDEGLLVIEPTNVGYRLRKLSRATGYPTAPDTLPLDLDRLDPAGLLVSEGTLYHAGGGQLSAWSVRDGKPLWQRPLVGEGAWRLTRAGPMLLAYLDRAPALRFRFRSLVGSLQWQVGPMPGDASWSILCLDPATGTLAQRVNLEPERLLPETLPSGSRPAALLPGVGLDRVGDGTRGPMVVLDRRGLVVAVGNEVKVLAADRSPRTK